MKTEITYRDPAELRLHPLQKHLPEPDKTSPEWLAFVDRLQASGPESIPPVIITPEGHIMDGGRRWRAARQLQWESLPTMERPERDAAALIVDSLMGQRNLPRGTKVYLALTLLPKWVESSEARRLNNLCVGKTSQKPLFLPKPSDLASGDIKGFCESLGVSDETFRRARRVHDLFTKHPEFKAELEHDLLSGEKSLWNVESAIQGALTDQTKREPAKERSQLELFTDGLSALAKSGKYWNRFYDAQREQVLAEWRKTAAALPETLRAEMRRVLDEI